MIVRADRVVLPEGEWAAAVGIRDGRIAVVDQVNVQLDSCAEVRLEPEHVLLPGLADTHVHLQDPGHTTWEDFDSGTGPPRGAA